MTLITNAEQLFVMGVYKANSLFRSGYMLIQPFFHIAVKVVVSLCRVATEQESVLVGICTETVLGTIIPHKGDIEELPCNRRHITTAVQKPLIFTQGADYIVKPLLNTVPSYQTKRYETCSQSRQSPHGDDRYMLLPSAVASTSRMEWGICVSNTLGLCP